MIFGADSIATYLRSVLEERTGRDPEYSLRAFARDLGLSPAYLSQIISRKKKLSPARRLEVAARLGLAGAESRYFYLLAQEEAAPSDEVRLGVRKLLNDLALDFKEASIDGDAFKAISDWYHVAILEMTYLDAFDGTPERTATLLGISHDEAAAALERLTRLGLLAPGADGRLVKVDTNARFRAKHTNEAFASFLRQMMALGAEAMDHQPIAERVIMAQTFCIGAEQMEEARDITREYMQRMASLFSTATRRTNCYQLNLQFFNLTDGRSKAPVVRED